MEDTCVMCGNIIPEGTHVCPICRQKYSERPALSRRDNTTYICPTCATAEALDAARELLGEGMSDAEWVEYKKQIIAAMKDKG